MAQRTKELFEISNPGIIAAVRPLTVVGNLELATRAALKFSRGNGSVLRDKTEGGWGLSTNRTNSRHLKSSISTRLIQVDQTPPASVSFRARTFAITSDGQVDRNTDGTRKRFHDDLMSGPLAWKFGGVSRLDLIQIGSWHGLEPAIITVDALGNSPERAEELVQTAGGILLGLASSDMQLTRQ